MEEERASDFWEAAKKGDSWVVQTDDRKTIAMVEKGDDVEAHAKLIAQSPYMLKAMVELIGDKDLPDSGEVSGAVVCDLSRSAVILAEGYMP